MVGGVVGQHRGGEVDGVDAVQRESDGGDLHGAGGVAAVGHVAQVALEVGRLGRGALAAAFLLAHDGLDGADHPARAPVGGQHLPEQVRGRGLAVGARDADHRQLCRGIVVEARRDRCHRRARVGDDHLGDAEPQGPLDDQRGGAPPHRVAAEVVAVRLEAGHAEEQRAGLDVP